MDLNKFFQMQKELDKHIETEHPRKEGESRLKEKALALLVEVGELANELRFFKYWSHDQKPRTKDTRVPCMMEEDKEYFNPSLDEFVDGWHFILSIGLELNVEKVVVEPIKKDNLTDQFLGLFNAITVLSFGITQSYDAVVSAYAGLAEMLGYSWEEVEEAYRVKNEINHKRQEVGY